MSLDAQKMAEAIARAWAANPAWAQHSLVLSSAIGGGPRHHLYELYAVSADGVSTAGRRWSKRRPAGTVSVREAYARYVIEPKRQAAQAREQARFRARLPLVFPPQASPSPGHP